MIGQTIAHYTITARIGAGGMGEVFRARDEKLNRDVALKILPETYTATRSGWAASSVKPSCWPR